VKLGKSVHQWEAGGFDILHDNLYCRINDTWRLAGLPLKQVAGKVAFITGGASGIGLGVTRVLLRAGMRVVIADIREDHLQETAARLQGEPDVHFIRLDVTDRLAMARAADEAESVFGKVHVLCNNAGVGLLGGAKLATYADWDWGISVNLGGVINGIQTFLPRILKHGEGGHIVNTASIGALCPMPDGIVYITAKTAVCGLTEGLRGELAKDGIGVTLLCPGPTATNIHEVARLRPERYRDSGFHDIEAGLSQRTASSLWMDPVEVGERVLDAILHNRLFVITHNEFKEGAQERCKALIASFPKGEVQPERLRALGFEVTNPIYTEELHAASSAP
jgi:NAD(P)-dependent dehydrogenase (short-subunit alcohol dehydrogenase family)